MRLAVLLVWAAVCGQAAWLNEVDPIITAAERKTYLALTDPAARQKFEDDFWQSRVITQSEYLRRIEYTDSYFGAGKHLSGLNTDQGRVYLSLGAPAKISRFANSRIFFPLEIWYYEAPARQFLFFQANGTGLYRSYSPMQHTIRALLNPQSSTRGMFPVNDVITTADVRARLALGPLEDEILDAAMTVGAGVKGIGNEHELALALAPRQALQKPVHSRVTSRLVNSAAIARPRITTWQTRGANGIPIIDFQLLLPAAVGQAQYRLRRNNVEIAQAQTNWQAATAGVVAWRQRLPLLAGEYTLVLQTGGREWSYAVSAKAAESGALFVGAAAGADQERAFFFGDRQVVPASGGREAVLQIDVPGRVQWRLWQGLQLVWQSTSAADGGWASVELPAQLPPGSYELEAKSGEFAARASVQLTEADEEGFAAVQDAAVGADADALLAREYFSSGDTTNALMCASRLAQRGRLDAARDVAKLVLDQQPAVFEALVLMGFVEAKLQDHAVAAAYYTQALALRSSLIVQQARDESLRLAAGQAAR